MRKNSFGSRSSPRPAGELRGGTERGKEKMRGEGRGNGREGDEKFKGRLASAN